MGSSLANNFLWQLQLWIHEVVNESLNILAIPAISGHITLGFQVTTGSLLNRWCFIVSTSTECDEKRL